ncbi:nucleotidyltransferase family protein [Acetobacter musti]|uniref:nucleotidyltransferase family protein n=1 Tax=Acetobacter musti TaxID=864732 RepID=UPI00156A993A|nr:nucleotidyltransferase family protein [Acetobacter musti]
MDTLSKISTLLRTDPLRWRLLGAVRSLNLPDCWIGAGFVRNAVWDHLHRRPASSPGSDIDVIWFDPDRTDPEEDRRLEAVLQAKELSVSWSVKNQARMHERNGDLPYLSAVDAMRYWPETATAIAARRDASDHCQIAAPFGAADLLNLILRPTPHFSCEKKSIYRTRLRDKGWTSTWPLLRDAGR